MCGRYWITSPADVLISRFRVRGEATPLRPRWNAAPGQDLPVIRLGAEGERLSRADALGPRARVGLGPRGRGPADQRARRDGRGETELPRVRSSGGAPSCPRTASTSGSATATGPCRTAFRVKSGEPFAIAGLWDEWRPRQGPPLRTFALLTTEASPEVARVHDRMPVILEPGAEDLWLDPRVEDAASLAEVLRPLPAGALESFEVSPRVNSPEVDDPSVFDAASPLPPEPPKRARPARELQRSLWENGDDDAE